MPEYEPPNNYKPEAPMPDTPTVSLERFVVLARAASRACDVMGERVENGKCNGSLAEMNAARKDLLNALLFEWS